MPYVVLVLAVLGAEGVVFDRGEVCLLLERVDAYFESFKSGDYAAAYRLLDRTGFPPSYSERKWSRGVRKMSRRMKVKWEDQEVEALRVHGEVARLTVARSGTIGPERVSAEEFDYWVFKDENWYRIPLQLDESEWDPDEAQEVAIPRDCSGDGD